jgi:sialate O-acetylesterase
MNYPRLLVVGALASVLSTPVFAQLKLPRIISDHMVLQASQPDAVWGWAAAGTAVKIDFTDGSGKTLAQAEATADANGKWSAMLPTLAPGTAGQLQVSAGSETKTVQDVLVGEDWLCSGQSNMGYIIGEKSNLPQNIATAKREATAANGAIRYFSVIKLGSATPQDDVYGDWQVASPDNVELCSAVAWNFGVELHDKLNEPIGLVVSAMGGTAAETWLPKEVIDGLKCGPEINDEQAKRMQKDPNLLTDLQRQADAWLAKHPTPESQEADSRAIAKEPGESITHIPSRYYNGMIHGIEPYSLKGVIWFQGGDNLQHPDQYPELIQAVINTWRKEFNTDFPFYYVELQNEEAPQKLPSDDLRNCAMIRWAQNAALDLPKTDVATAVDLNKGKGTLNPHFPNKKPLGQRLAHLALEQVYGQNLGEVHSPAFASFGIEGDKVRIKLTHADGLRAMNGGELKGFAIRGAGGPWVWADATIDGTDLLVSSAQVPSPTAVRYAWAQNPILSVENGVGLPLRPFRTDNDPSTWKK